MSISSSTSAYAALILYQRFTCPSSLLPPLALVCCTFYKCLLLLFLFLRYTISLSQDTVISLYYHVKTIIDY